MANEVKELRMRIKTLSRDQWEDLQKARPRGRRGRPKGSGYDDAQALQLMADLLHSKRVPYKTSAARIAVDKGLAVTDSSKESTIHRLLRKFKADEGQLHQEAEKRDRRSQRRPTASPSSSLLPARSILGASPAALEMLGRETALLELGRQLAAPQDALLELGRQLAAPQDALLELGRQLAAPRDALLELGRQGDCPLASAQDSATELLADFAFRPLRHPSL